MNPAQSQPGNFVFGKYIPYPMFMGYATTYAKKHTDAEILFRDSVVLHESYNQFFTYLLAEKPDLIFMEGETPSWEHDRKLIEKMGELLPQARFAITGSLPSVRGEEILQTRGVVAAVRGEYDKNCVKVINGATGIIEHDLMTEAEMNDAPFPFYEEATARRYWDPCPQGIVYPNAQVWASRGCPYKCFFCKNPANMTGNDPDGTKPRRVRHYSTDYLLRFLTHLRDTYGFRSIYFDGDTENLNNKHTLEICAVMRQIGLPWTAMCRADTSTREVWREMKASGCYGVKIGFETGSQRVMDEIINKKLDLKEAEETGRFLTEIGINWHGTFTLSAPGTLPGEDDMTHALIARCKDAGMQTHQVSTMAVHDGTPMSALVRTKQKMKVYPGAFIDESFVEVSDGAVNIGR